MKSLIFESSHKQLECTKCVVKSSLVKIRLCILQSFIMYSLIRAYIFLLVHENMEISESINSARFTATSFASQNSFFDYRILFLHITRII